MDIEWTKFIEEKQKEPYMQNLKAFIKEERAAGKEIYPAGPLVFNAFELCPWHKLKVVIIGQDPYHTPMTAHGLAFSSLHKLRPPSLENIFKEIFNNLLKELQEMHPKTPIDKKYMQSLNLFKSNNLTEWADQGVLLLNTILTVERSRPLSHEKKGWERFASEVIEYISEEKRNVVWMLWGAHAQKAEKYIKNPEKHLILKCAHPSPLSANKGGWFGNEHFYKCNKYIVENKVGNPPMPINWGIYN